MQIILSDPAREDTVAIVSVSKEPCGTNPECVIEPGEHPNLSQRSYVRFDFGMLSSSKAILEGADKGVIQVSKRVSDALLARIQRAALESRRTRNEVKELLRKQGLPLVAG